MLKKRINTITLSAIFLVVCFIPSSLLAELKPEVTSLGIENPKQVLFMGNSYLYYNNSLHNIAVRIARAADKENSKSYKYKSVTISGGYLSDQLHAMEGYVKPGAFGYDKPFDVVILQGYSNSQVVPEKRENFDKTVKQLDKIIKASGAKTALYMTHAYGEKHKKYDPAMIEGIRKGYLETGNEVGALVIPVGLAFDAAYESKPGIKLHMDYDGSHPTKLGSYLAANVVYASLYGKSPVGNTFREREPEIDEETATFLQNVAWDTVKSFYGW